MFQDKPIIGGEVEPEETEEAVVGLPKNRTLLLEKLTTKEAQTPEIVHGLTNLKMVFEHFQPSVQVELEGEKGVLKKDLLQFRDLEDFSLAGITAQSDLLKDLTLKQDEYQKIARQISKNSTLRAALSNPEGRQNFIAALNSLIGELDAKK